MLNLQENIPNLDLNQVYVPKSYFEKQGILHNEYDFDEKVNKLVDTNSLISASKDIKQIREYIDFFYAKHWNTVEGMCNALEEQLTMYDMNFAFTDQYKIKLNDVPSGLEEPKTRCKLIDEDFNQLSTLLDCLNKFKVDKHSVERLKNKYSAIYRWWELNYSIYKMVHSLHTLDRVYEEQLSETEFTENYLDNVKSRFNYHYSLADFNPKSEYGEVTPIDQFILNANFDKLKEHKEAFKKFLLNFQTWIITKYYEPF